MKRDVRNVRRRSSLRARAASSSSTAEQLTVLILGALALVGFLIT